MRTQSPGRLRTLAVGGVALGGLAVGFLGVAASSPAVPAATPATHQPPPASTPQAAPASAPEATLAAQTGPSPQQVAQDVAEIAVGNGPIPALQGGDGQATNANCDPSTALNAPDAISASCDITYSDGSVVQQTVTIAFDGQGNLVANAANVGTEQSEVNPNAAPDLNALNVRSGISTSVYQDSEDQLAG